MADNEQYAEIRAALGAIFNAPDAMTLQEVRRQFAAACTAVNVYNLLMDRDRLASQVADQSGEGAK